VSRERRWSPHPFDPVSFVIGAVAVAAGLVVLLGGSLVDAARALVPIGLIAVGVALLVKAGARNESPVPVADGAPADGRPSGADLYDLLVPDPVESFMADLEARRRRGGADEPAVSTGFIAETKVTAHTKDTADTEATNDTAETNNTTDAHDTADTAETNDTAETRDTADTAETNDTADTAITTETVAESGDPADQADPPDAPSGPPDGDAR
jgi:hypothetical protein